MNESRRIAEAARRGPIYRKAVDHLVQFLRIIERGNLRPQAVDQGGHWVVRFLEKSPEEALLLKFARLVSLNRAMLLMIDAGLVQEQGILQRCIDETNEDIMFIGISLCSETKTEKVEAYLTEFWKEEFSDPNNPIGTRNRRGFSRKGISAILNRAFGLPNPSYADQNSKLINSMYSGFVHGAAPQILEMYDLENQTFLVQGIGGTNRHIDYIFDAQNCLYRSLLSSGVVAKAFGSDDLLEQANVSIAEFRDAIGIDDLEMKFG